MATRRENSWILALLAVGLVPLWQASCVPSDGVDPTGTGGGSATAGTTGTAGDNGTAGTTGVGGTTGDGGTTGQGGSTDPAGRGGTTGQAGSTDPAGRGGTTGQGGSTDPVGRGGTTGQGGSTAGAGGSGPGGSGPGGSSAGRGGTTGQAGRGGTTGTAGTTGSAGTTGTGGAVGDACPAGTTAEFGCGKPRSMGFMGCSMSVNVATGYQRRMGMRMWAPISAYGGQVVQSWTPASGGVWTSFDNAANTNGKPTDIWMQICIFAQQGVTAAEVQKMITNARAHSTPTTRIWISGQPTYNAGHTCSLAGTGGAELTDMRAKEAHNPANGVYYAGTFLLRDNVSPSEVSTDTCHASSAGELALGDQFIAKFGK